MKTFKFLSMAIMCMAMVLVSCTGDRGETGPQGKQGIAGVDGSDGADGTDGADGSDGADGVSCWDLNGNGIGDADEDVNGDGNFDASDCQGADGNANVQAFNILVTDFSGSSLPFTIPMDPVDLPNYAMLFYLKNKNGIVYSVPGPMDANFYYSRLFYFENGNSSDGTINFYKTSDDSAHNIAAGYFTNLKIIAIETTTGAKNAQQSITDELKDAGVDTSDYDAVAEYFGLDK